MVRGNGKLLGVYLAGHHGGRSGHHLLYVSCYLREGNWITYHNGVTQSGWRLVLFERKLGHKIAANRPKLAQLLLKPLRIALQVLQDMIVSGHKYRRNINQQLPQLDAVAALVRGAHENDAVCRHFDRPLLLQSALARSIRMNKRLEP